MASIIVDQEKFWSIVTIIDIATTFLVGAESGKLLDLKRFNKGASTNDVMVGEERGMVKF